MRHPVRHTLLGGLVVTATLLLAAGTALAAPGSYDGQGQNRDSRAAIEAAEADALGKADAAGSDRSSCSRTFLQVYRRRAARPRRTRPGSRCPAAADPAHGHPPAAGMIDG